MGDFQPVPQCISETRICILYRTLRRYINTVLLLLLLYRADPGPHELRAPLQRVTTYVCQWPHLPYVQQANNQTTYVYRATSTQCMATRGKNIRQYVGVVKTALAPVELATTPPSYINNNHQRSWRPSHQLPASLPARSRSSCLRCADSHITGPQSA